MAENNRKSLKIWYDEFEIAHDAFDYNEDDCKEFSYWITQFFMGKWYECKRKRVKTYIKYNLKRLEFVTKQKLNGGKGGLQSADNKQHDKESLSSTLASENASGLASGLASLTTTITNTTTITPTILQNEKEISEKPVYKKVEKQTIEERKINFSSTLEPYLQSFGRDILNKFFLYWTEPNQKTNKMRFEFEKTWSLERRLNTWKENESKFTKPTFANNQNQDSKFVKSMKNALSANEILKQEYLDSLNNPNNE